MSAVTFEIPKEVIQRMMKEEERKLIKGFIAWIKARGGVVMDCEDQAVKLLKRYLKTIDK